MATKKGRRHNVTGKARRADAANLAAARAKHGKGRLTAAQLRADRANLVLARSAHTAAQVAADRANGKKASLAMRSHPSAALLAAEARWVQKGRLAWRSRMLIQHQERLTVRADTVIHVGSLRRVSRAPMGSVRSYGRLAPRGVDRGRFGRGTFHPPTLLGEPKRFARAVSPTGTPAQSTAWRRAHAHHFRQRLAPRRPTTRRAIGGWHRRRKRYTPR